MTKRNVVSATRNIGGAALSSGPRRRPLRRAGAALAWLVAASACAPGCQTGPRWELGFFKDVHAKACERGKLTFVYLRDWTSVDCTRFEDHVLSTPEVRSATADLVCVPLQITDSRDRELANSWKIGNAPAFVIVDENRTVLAFAEGANMSVQVVRDAIYSAKQKRQFTAAAPAASQPTP